MKKIVIAGGGTLGHILPIIPLLKELYNNYNLYFIGSKKGLERKYFIDNNITYYFKSIFYLDMDGFNRKNILKNVNTLIKYINSKKKLKNIYKTIKPDLVIGMGGYISGIVIKEAINKKIKTIIYEQNSILGLANKMVINKVDQVLLSYEINGIKNKNIKIIGNPRYSYVLENYKRKEEKTILIVSGSLGSKTINDFFINNIQYIIRKDYIIKIVVGKKYYNLNKDKINSINEEYKGKIIIYEFINDLVEELAKASVVISRSGASTISEIQALSVPTIFIPSPYVAKNHQYLNALYLKEKNCCFMIEEKDLDITKINEYINDLTSSYYKRKEITNNFKKLNTNDPKLDFIQIIKELI